jgi:hypothetical protein
MTLPRQTTAPRPTERPFAPRGRQKTIVACRERELIVVGPADTGKTRTIFEKIHRALELYPGARVLYCRKTRASCTDTGLVTFEDRVLPPGHYLRRGPKRDQRHSYRYANGAELVVGGLDDMEKHRSSEYDWAYVQEVSEATEDDWENLLRATSGRAGVFPYAQLIGDMNPEYPMHWAHRRCDEGTAAEVVLTHEDNPSITEARLDALRRMTGARLERFYYGRRVVDVDGSYYGTLLHDAEEDGRIVALPPGTDPVYVSWDFGVSDFTSLWFWQRSRHQPLLIDYYEGQGEGLRHYVQVLQRKAQRFGYIYGGMVYPHDAEARMQGEVAETRLDVLRRLLPGVRDTVVPRVQDIMDRVQASRDCIAVATFDNHRAPVRDGQRDPEARNTAQGVQRLLMYQRPYSKATGTYGTVPKHNEASHAADAFGTGAMALDWMHAAPRAEQRARDIPYLDRWEEAPRYGRAS